MRDIAIPPDSHIWKREHKVIEKYQGGFETSRAEVEDEVQSDPKSNQKTTNCDLQTV